MLTKLVVENFLSFKEKTVIDFKKTSYTILPQNINQDKILKGAIFVGANASGKTNVIKSLSFLLDFFFGEFEYDKALEYLCLFSEKKTFSLEYTFWIDNCEIVYYLSVDCYKRLFEEKLMVDDNLLMNRMGKTAKSFINNAEGILYSEEVPDDSSFLRTIYFNTKFAGNRTLIKWMEFLKKSIWCDLYSCKISSSYGDDLDLRKYLDKEGTERVNDFFRSYNFEQEIEYANIARGNHFKISSDEKMIFFRRKDIDDPIPSHFESLGNKTLIKLLPVFLSIIDNGGMLLIDEFSSGFHNDLEELLVKHFMKYSKNSQLFLVSHSTNLLKNSILRPDQEYSVYFDGAHGSKLKRFSDEQPRNAQNIEKMYNSGVFGGLPNYEVCKDED